MDGSIESLSPPQVLPNAVGRVPQFWSRLSVTSASGSRPWPLAVRCLSSTRSRATIWHGVYPLSAGTFAEAKSELLIRQLRFGVCSAPPVKFGTSVT